MSKITIFSILFLFALQVSAQFRTETVYLPFEGIVRSYELFVPTNYSAHEKIPLLFVLHGGGGNAKGIIRNTRTRFNQLANQQKFIVVYPNGYKKGWNDGARDTIAQARKLNIDDVGFFVKMMDKLTFQFPIDQDRIFACGISNGGFMVQRLAFELSDKIKGIGVVAANLSVDLSRKPFPENPVSVLFINGTLDPLVPYNGGDVIVFKQKRGSVLSVEESIDIWKRINNCRPKSLKTTFPDLNNKDNCTAFKKVWKNRNNQNIKVIAIKIENGGHTWPDTNQYLPRRLVGNTNRDFNGCDEIWNFFKSLM